MDIFIEQIVKRDYGVKDYYFFVAIVLVCGIIIVGSMAFLPSFSIFILAGLCVGTYYLISSRNLEFEYSVTNSDITIDKIINRRNRKNVISIDAHNIEAIGKYKAEEHKAKNYSERVTVSENDNGNDAWYFIVRHPQRGNVLVILSPNKKVFAAIKPFLSRQVAIDDFGRN